jgi:hypothetical protein
MRPVRLAAHLALALSVLAISAPGAEAKPKCSFSNAIKSNGQTFHGATCHNDEGGKKCVCSYVVCKGSAPAAFCQPLVAIKNP